MDNGHSHGHKALAGWDLRRPRLAIYPHVPICPVLYRHALAQFVLAQVEICGSLTSISLTIYKICSHNPSSLRCESQIHKKQTNMTYQSPVQWSITKDLLFMERFLLPWQVRAVADMVGIWSICLRHASALKFVFFACVFFFFCIRYLFWQNEKVPLTCIAKDLCIGRIAVRRHAVSYRRLWDWWVGFRRPRELWGNSPQQQSFFYILKLKASTCCTLRAN